ncbi:sigma 54-interacting transcriptional regulator [Hymenobacter negativus]|uniref:Sigma 54-interacting transcriptional regulator n=1 Tax=Hymenobacter negativus TaxID=2795026 RepID=A0ABS3QLG7_9BACT|nr:sigma 54-interacting transcriptional regulator [Hymenobacter negativus]MBO2012120.1 sigma 54-interacting transcriptional regulator [Hymenobacter negativus]
MPTKALLAPVPAQQTVLIVEDEFAVANDLRLILERAGYRTSGPAYSVAEALEISQQHRPDLVLLDIHLQGPETGIDFARYLNTEQIPFVFVSANTNTSVLDEVKDTQPYGFLVKPFREKDVLVALEIAYYRHANRVEVRLREEQNLQLKLLSTLTEVGEWEQCLQKVARSFEPFIPFDYLVIGLETDEILNTFRSCSFFRIGTDEYQMIRPENFLQMTGLTLEKYQRIRRQVPYNGLAAYNGTDFELFCQQNPLLQLIANTFRLQSHLMMPLKTAQNGGFFIAFYSRQPQPYQPQHVSLLQQLQPALTVTVDRLLAFDKIEQLSEQLRQENLYLAEEVKTGANYEEIIGASPTLLHVFKSIGQVAPTDYSVLVMGETGTGKELIARAVHNRSGRKGKALIKVNCAALPPNLIESELFGHEKGSFTGAFEKRIGKFELAHGGTIFLDEIGELPLELQPKLLRVLQEKEIERIGGRGPIPCNVRIIAATNRRLQEEVEAGRFRADLYYRLNVFPIQLPPLRDRREDLPLLTAHFLQKIAKNLGKQLTGISETSLQQMQAYHWPGNIRELEHLLERAAIMATTPTVSLAEPLLAPPPAETTPILVAKPREQAERENVLAALRATNYRIRGENGAAVLLNVKPTTLEAQMVRLGIKREGSL